MLGFCFTYYQRLCQNIYRRAFTDILTLTRANH